MSSRFFYIRLRVANFQRSLILQEYIDDKLCTWHNTLRIQSENRNCVISFQVVIEVELFSTI